MGDTTVCQSSNCLSGKNTPAKLECPTCNKLGIRFSLFCGQECFKAGWKSHKVIHELAKKTGPITNADGTYNPFPKHGYTGPLRPVYPLSPARIVPDHIRRPDYAQDGLPKSEYRDNSTTGRILRKDEQDKMRTVCRLSREVLDIAASHIRPGITTDEIDEIVHNETISRHMYPSPLNYHNFPKSTCTSINETICHGIPDKRKLVEGDIINLDVSCYYEGYHGDVNGTYPVGKIDAASENLIRTCRLSLDEAIKVCKPGALFRDIGKTIEPIATAAGLAVVRNFVGHGVNDLFHTRPDIAHYARNKVVGAMKPGMCFTIEPMLNIGTNWNCTTWPDDWTATTVDGQRSAQFEETLLITETGVEVLSASPLAAKLKD